MREEPEMNADSVLNALAYVKDPVTLVAFLAAVAYATIRVKPELFYELLQKKLSKQHFFVLSSRFLLYGLIVLMGLIATSFAAQVASAIGSPSIASVQAVQSDVEKVNV